MSDDHIPFANPRDRFYEGAAAGVTALIVEDDPRTAFALTALLQRGGMNVVGADCGLVALHTLDHRDDIAIILMDIMMPVMNGYQTMSAIRLRRQATELPIIAVTGKVASGERQRCLAAGASDYIAMPIDTAVLLTAISHCLLTAVAQGTPSG